MRVRLILSEINAGWIIGKIANRLLENLSELGVDVEISDSPSSSVDINHWMSWAFVEPYRLTKSTMMITHIDDPYKVNLIKSHLSSGTDIGVCMSNQMMQMLIDNGVKADQLTYVLPAHDGLVKPKRTTIGLTTRLYSDGRKREDLLVKLSRVMSLELFHFEIIGDGWDNVIPVLEDAGATVSYYPGTDDYKEDYRVTLEKIPTFDYYLYLGLDEGSMGTLDALAAGVKTIVTTQGFHLDAANGITHPFWTFEELREVFQSIDAERRSLMASVEQWTWLEYARDHMNLWTALLNGQTVNNLDPTQYLGKRYIQNSGERHTRSATTRDKVEFYSKMLAPVRVKSAVGKLPMMKPLRKMLGR
jgi:hypothetical protein